MQFPKDLWKNQRGDYFFLSTKSRTGRWKDHPIRRGDWDKVQEVISSHRDHDIYMCPHGFTQKKRLREYSVDPHLLYADLDEADPHLIAIRPTIAIQSSPGRYVGYWITDKPAGEELNQRLSYMIGSDVSGWDRTQVLRTPGTRNLKYNSEPRVRVLWTDGPSYSLDKLESLVPEIQKDGGLSHDGDAQRIYEKYESKLSRWARREMFNQRVIQGRRSEVLWKLHHACLEAGMTRDEALSLLWVSPWNKFAERRGGLDQMKRELNKASSDRFSGRKKDGESSPEPQEEPWNPLPRSLAEVKSENIDFIIPGLCARKELSIVEGDPGLGKSYLVQMIAGSICDGFTIPCFNRYKPIQGRVAYFDTENTASTVARPRMEENGIVHLENYFQGEEPFSIDDETRWEAVIDRLDELRPDLIVFDTINTYIGGTDTYRSSETQQAMAFFKELAVRFNCSVVLLRHLTKGGKDKALYRGQGSIAFTGASRIVATVGRLPDDPDIRVVACTKNNISSPFPSFTYMIEGLPDTLKKTNRSKLTWGSQVDLTSDDILSITPTSKNNDKDTAEKWLRETLEEEGRQEATKLFKMAEARSISRTTLNRVADTLGVIKELSGFGRGKQSWWSLPQSA